MTAMVTGPVVGIHGVYPDKLNSHSGFGHRLFVLDLWYHAPHA